MIKSSFMKDGLPTLKPADVNGLKDVKLIDVRMPNEFTGELSHINGAELVTLGGELEKFLTTESKETPLVFICKSGGRSGQATAIAKNMGFTDVYNMEGGMMAWNALSLPVA